MPIRVFLITNFRLLGKGIEDLLKSEQTRFIFAGAAASLVQAVSLMADAVPDVVLLDADFSQDDLVPFIAASLLAGKAKFLLLTRLNDVHLLDRAVIQGARGVVDCTTSPEMLMNAIEKVHEGQVWLDRTATGRIFVELSRINGPKPDDHVSAKVALLTEREQAIVAFIARNSGEPGKIVAKRLHISESTLRNHLTSIYEKLGVTGRHGLLSYAFEHGLAERLSQ